jgi:hypothetical protein
MFETILNEALKGNFSWFILMVNIGQLIMNVATFVAAVMTLIITIKDRKNK